MKRLQLTIAHTLIFLSLASTSNRYPFMTHPRTGHITVDSVR